MKDDNLEEGRPEETPNDIFKRMVINDKMQNNNLANKMNKKSGSYKLKNGRDGEVSKKITYTRFFICILGVLSLALSQMNRMVINVCIPSMVDPSMLKHSSNQIVSGGNGGDDSCPWPEEPTTTCPPTEEPTTTLAPPPAATTILPAPTTTYSPSFTDDPMLYMLTSQSPDIIKIEPIEDVPDSTVNQTVLDEVVVEKFKWNMNQQGYLLGGFFWSYFIFMVLGGWIAETYGAKYVLLLGVGGSSLISLFTPSLAQYSLTLLICSRVLMGTLQAGVFPAMYAVFSKWLTMSEASIFAPMIKMNLRLGMLMASAVPGLVPSWPNVFYLTGIAGSIWSVLWFLFATSRPEDNRWVSEAELSHILRKKRKIPQVEATPEENGLEMGERVNGEVIAPATKKPQAATPPPTPWLKILTNPSVIGLVIVKFTFNTCADFLSIELPSYLSYVHHVDRKKISAVTSFMFAIQVGLIVFVGWLAKEVVKRRPLGLSKTAIRKIFQGFTNLGAGTCLLLMTFNDCNLVYVIVLLQIISFISMFGAGGEIMLPYDLSDQYPATIMAIANSVANMSGLVVTTVAGRVLGDNGSSISRWNLLIYLICGANFFGGLAFIGLVKAEPIDFEGNNKKTDEDQGSETSTTKNKSKNKRSVDVDIEQEPTYMSAAKLEPPQPLTFPTITELPEEKANTGGEAGELESVECGGGQGEKL